MKKGELQKWEKVAKVAKSIISDYDESNNYLTRWISFRIAELVTDEKSTKNSHKRNRLRKECSELIINLWRIQTLYELKDDISKFNFNISKMFDVYSPTWMNENGENKNSIKNIGVNINDKGYEELLIDLMLLQKYEKQIIIIRAIDTLPSKRKMSSMSDREIQEIGVDLARYDELLELKDEYIKDLKLDIVNDIVKGKSEKKKIRALGKALKIIHQKRNEIIKSLSNK